MNKSTTIKEVQKIIGKYGFVLVRQKKHLIFRNNTGIQFVTAATSSDHRFLKNVEARIQRLIKNHDSNHTNQS